VTCCGMTVMKVWMLGVSVQKMKVLTLKIDTVTMIGKGR
jgi:hypothetical protein